MLAPGFKVAADQQENEIKEPSSNNFLDQRSVTKKKGGPVDVVYSVGCGAQS
jgi:hypothetical protein